ncbi:MAG: biopolymer transporter ExbD [candidate division KSB1 bacterium]|nr:biopolymer transporter ExbD [candidate division KSB1 bacterium]
MHIESTRKRMVLFSTISLTDIVLLLLIFFLLTSSFVIQPGIKVRLPKAAAGEQTDSNKLFITITREQRIFLNQQHIDENGLGNRIKQHIADHPESVIVIRADQDLPLNAMIRVVDIAKLAGAERFMIATQSITRGM